MKTFRSVGISLSVFSFVWVGTALTATGITFTDLGTLLYSDGIRLTAIRAMAWPSMPVGRRRVGVITKEAGIGPPAWEAFRYSGSLPIQGVGCLPTINNAFPMSYGYAINDSGSVAGYSPSGADGNLAHAVVTSGSSLIDLGSIQGTSGGATSRAYGINASGTVVGMSYYSGASGTTTAFVDTYSGAYDTATGTYSSGGTWSMLDIGGVLGGTSGNSMAFGINAAGAVTGTLLAAPTPIMPTPLCGQLPGR